MEASRNRWGKNVIICDIVDGFIPEEAGAVGADADRGEGHDGEGGALIGPVGLESVACLKI